MALVDALETGVENFGHALDLLDDVKHPSGHLIVSLNVVHSHVVNVFVCWCYDLDDAIRKGIADEGDDSWKVVVVGAENGGVVRLDQVAEISVDVWGFLVVFRHR